MRVFDITNEQGQVVAFEIPNTLLSRHAAARLASRIPGVIVTRPVRRLFSAEPDRDEFCEFHLGNSTFVMWEPFGDNSRFWIGGSNPKPSPELETVRAAFQGASLLRDPSAFIRVLVFMALISWLVFQAFASCPAV